VQQEEPALIRTTGVGSMPGTDPDEATRVVVGEFAVPHVVELPGRGPGADILGRALALLADSTGDFAGETTPTGWRLAGGRAGGDRGRRMRRGAAWLAEDADRLEQHLAGFAGEVKVQVCGPWTLAAGVEGVRGTRLLADPGACREVSEGLATAIGGVVSATRRRVPGAQVVVQVDEPLLPAVLSGRVRTPSGRGAVRIPGDPEVQASLAGVVGAARDAGAELVLAHCCAREVPFDALQRSGFAGVSVDLRAVGGRADEALGRWWDRGGHVVLGLAPSTDPGASAVRAMPDSLARAAAGLWHRIGFGVADVGETTWLSPSCGLAGASPGWSRRVGGLLGGAARMLLSSE
jgi:hypothetical protein